MKLTGFNSPGNMMQQGGEFAFSAGYKCDFAHRMTNRSGKHHHPTLVLTPDHCEATDVIALAEGVKYYEQAEMGLAL
jgi:hypothetical protein